MLVARTVSDLHPHILANEVAVLRSDQPEVVCMYLEEGCMLCQEHSLILDLGCVGISKDI